MIIRKITILITILQAYKKGDYIMTNQNAIEILRTYTNIGYGVVIEGENTMEIEQALELAIKALKRNEEAPE